MKTSRERRDDDENQHVVGRVYILVLYSARRLASVSSTS